MDIITNHGAVLVGAVVVGGDAARAIVDALAHSGIAQVRQMVGFGAFCHRGVFDLYKVTDMDFSTQLRTGPQAGKRANQRTLPDLNTQIFTVNVGKRVDHGVGCNDAIGYHAVGAYSHAMTQSDCSFKHTIHINFNVLPACQRAAQIKTGGVGEANALCHQRQGLP